MQDNPYSPPKALEGGRNLGVMNLFSHPIFIVLPFLCFAVGGWFGYCNATIELGPDGRIPASSAKSFVSNSNMGNLFGILGGASSLIHLWSRKKLAGTAQSDSSVKVS